MDIVFASANHNKLVEARKIFGPEFNIILPEELGYFEEIPETHETISENSIEKAEFVWNKFHLPCFSDDTGLEVDALGGAPGVYSARYAGEPKSPKRNIERLLKELEGVPDEKRTAHFKCVVSYICDGKLTTFEGFCYGRINHAPVTEEAFGYDPVFIPTGSDKTMAEMTIAEKNTISHRGKAMDQLVCHLRQNLK